MAVGQDGLIIDPCPLLTLGGPVLLSVSSDSPWRVLYRESVIGIDGLGSPTFADLVRQASQAVRTAIMNSGPRYDM